MHTNSFKMRRLSTIEQLLLKQNSYGNDSMAQFYKRDLVCIDQFPLGCAATRRLCNEKGVATKLQTRKKHNTTQQTHCSYIMLADVTNVSFCCLVPRLVFVDSCGKRPKQLQNQKNTKRNPFHFQQYSQNWRCSICR